MSSKISALPNASALAGTEQITGLQGGTNKNVTPAQIATYIGVSLFAANYGGVVPNFTPVPSVAIAFDTSTGAQWNWYSGAWH